LTYRVIWSETAFKKLKKLDKKTAGRVIYKVEAIKQKPFRFIRRLKGFPLYSLRVGSLRVILSVESNKLVIFVVTLDHRHKVYSSL